MAKRLPEGHPVAGGHYIGERVRMTEEAEAMQGEYASVIGVVVGQSRNKAAIIVQRDGRTHRESWDPTFWQTATLENDVNLSSATLRRQRPKGGDR